VTTGANASALARRPALPRSFYARPTEAVAPELLGKLLVRRPPPAARERLGDTGPWVARIVEVEAYLGERDAASHARRGPTPRSAIMFGPPGHLYVYLIYGMHHCMNLVCEPDGVAGAVLVRAAEPIAVPEARDPHPLRGPGKLCAGLGITLADKGADVTDGGSGLILVDDGARPAIARSPRIGVDYAGAWAARPLRFFVPSSGEVSGPRPRSAVRRPRARAR
jgi:DNA-3-methyladenine glycosylase